MRRSHVVMVLASVLSAVSIGPPAYACVAGDERIFEVLRKGRPIGSHVIRRSTDGEATRVDIEIDLRVGFGPLTLFNYRHRSFEVWRGDELISLQTETNDNGERYQVRAIATAEGLEVVGRDGVFIAPADTMPTSYWNSEALTRAQLLDSQHGRLVQVDITPAGEGEILTDSVAIPARRSDVSGDLNLNVWYTEKGELGRIAFGARGARIDYRLICNNG